MGEMCIKKPRRSEVTFIWTHWPEPISSKFKNGLQLNIDAIFAKFINVVINPIE